MVIDCMSTQKTELSESQYFGNQKITTCLKIPKFLQQILYSVFYNFCIKLFLRKRLQIGRKISLNRIATTRQENRYLQTHLSLQVHGSKIFQIFTAFRNLVFLHFFSQAHPKRRLFSKAKNSRRSVLIQNKTLCLDNPQKNSFSKHTSYRFLIAIFDFWFGMQCTSYSSSQLEKNCQIALDLCGQCRWQHNTALTYNNQQIVPNRS